MEKKLIIRSNVNSCRVGCAICGCYMRPDTPATLTLDEARFKPVCFMCGWRHDPELAFLLYPEADNKNIVIENLQRSVNGLNQEIERLKQFKSTRVVLAAALDEENKTLHDDDFDDAPF